MDFSQHLLPYWSKVWEKNCKELEKDTKTIDKITKELQRLKDRVISPEQVERAVLNQCLITAVRERYGVLVEKVCNLLY